MEKSKFGLVVIVALVAGLLGGVVGFNVSGNGGSFGAATITASNALNQQRLINELSAIATPLTNIAQSSGTTVNSVSVATSSSVTGTMTVTGAVVKDGCVIGESTSTSYIAATCVISSANTATYLLQNASTTAVTLATTTLYATNIPNATFIAPTGL